MPAPSQPEKPQESVVVEIYDQQYHLRGTDTEYIIELARLVDAKMHTVAAQGATADSLRVAVLAALNFADELMQLREQQRTEPEQPGAPGSDSQAPAPETLRQRATSLNSLLDEVLGGRQGS
jgi:cell division protein ZapA